jgi:hypothetical protein
MPERAIRALGRADAVLTATEIGPALAALADAALPNAIKAAK